VLAHEHVADAREVKEGPPSATKTELKTWLIGETADEQTFIAPPLQEERTPAVP